MYSFTREHARTDVASLSQPAPPRILSARRPRTPAVADRPGLCLPPPPPSPAPRPSTSHRLLEALRGVGGAVEAEGLEAPAAHGSFWAPGWLNPRPPAAPFASASNPPRPPSRTRGSAQGLGRGAAGAVTAQAEAGDRPRKRVRSSGEVGEGGEGGPAAVPDGGAGSGSAAGAGEAVALGRGRALGQAPAGILRQGREAEVGEAAEGAALRQGVRERAEGVAERAARRTAFWPSLMAHIGLLRPPSAPPAGPHPAAHETGALQPQPGHAVHSNSFLPRNIAGGRAHAVGRTQAGGGEAGEGNSVGGGAREEGGGGGGGEGAGQGGALSSRSTFRSMADLAVQVGGRSVKYEFVQILCGGRKLSGVNDWDS